jgi:ribosomal protein S18
VTSTDVFTEREGQMSEEALTSYAYITSAQTAYAAYVREKCNDRITEISQAQSQLDAVPFYNFGKKASLKKWIEELTKAFESEVTAIMADYQRVMTPQLQKAQKALREIDETLASKRQLMRDTLVGQKQDQGSIQYLEDAVALFKADELKSVKHLIDVPVYSFIRTELVKLEKLLGEVDGLRKTVETQNAKAEEYRESIKQCEASGIDEEFKRKLSELETVVGMVDAKNIYRLFMDSLRAVYEKHGCAYREKDLYRHKLYVALCMCALYYRDKKNPERHISIDEAQDIAVSEYRLLRGILGGNATFNLYGDVNQLVYAYKGISEWEALGEVISDQLFFLNENYRNTVQITEYCNKEFEAEVLAIGLDGEAVREDSLEEIVRDMREYRGKNPQARTAIIYKKGMEALAEQVQNRMSEDEYASDLVDSAKVSLITVEMAKGLEFEKVAVIPDGMSVNEKYISYTRALESLAVISVPAEGSA